MNEKRPIAIVGAGLMGTAIATLCAVHGCNVILTDQNEGMLKSFPERALPLAQILASGTQSAAQIVGAVALNPSLEASVRDAFLVQETIHENLDAKRDLFRKLDGLCGEDVILATNTSSFLISDMCADLPGRRRTIGIHYVAPAHLIRAVEIIVAPFTDPALVDKARDFLKSIDHIGIVCKERAGFLINRIQYALKAEAQRMVDEGAATVSDVDAAFRLAIGPRLALWGPFMQEDLSTSKKTVLAVTEYIHKESGEAHFAPTPVLRRLAERGHIGAGAGAGWYKWSGNFAETINERDRQLSALLAWLRDKDRVGALGADGENSLAP